MRRRKGFTLVELLVAVALIVFVMVILSEAFSASLQAFRTLKAIGDLDARLRSASQLLRDDLAADHFEGKRRLSDPNFFGEEPPREGFVRVWHGSALSTTDPSPYFLESTDAAGDNVPSRRAIDHILHLTVKKRGNSRADWFGAQLPATSTLFGNGSFFTQPGDAQYQEAIGATTRLFTSQWAEVAYFLRPTGQFATYTPTGAALPKYVPLFALYRRQLLVLPNTYNNNWNPNNQIALGQQQQYLDFSAKPSGGIVYFNNPTDLGVPQRRFGVWTTDAPTPGSTGGFQYRGYPAERINVSTVPPEAQNLPGMTVGTLPYLTYPTADNNPNAQFGLVNVDPAARGADLLMADVVSFEIRVLTEVSPRAFITLHDPLLAVPPYNGNNPLYGPVAGLRQFSPRVFDTWTSHRDSVYDYTYWDPAQPPPPGQVPNFPNEAVLPLKVRVLALEITLRVWDPKTEQTRQVTIIQDM